MSAAAALALIMAGGLTVTSPRSETTVEQAKVLMTSGRFEEAQGLLDQGRESGPAEVERLFLLGLIAVERHQPRIAIERFRAASVREPGAIRIRLELARAFYLDRDYENALRQFQRARAGNPPPEVIATIDRFMADIRRNKKWSYHFGLAVAPDSNINGATSAREAVLLGVPFELGDNARRQSGIGLAIETRGEIAPSIGDGLRLRIGVGLDRREYHGGRFDDSILTAEAGPNLVRGRWDASLLASDFKRWFGQTRRIGGAGIRLEASYFPDSRSAIPVGLSVQKIRYSDAPAYDATLYAVQIGVARALSPSSVAMAKVGASRQQATAGYASNHSLSLGLSWALDMRGGFSIRVEPLVVESRYDAPDPFALVRRQDLLRQVSFSVVNRRIVLSRFTPRLSYTLARRDSSVELYRYSQRRLEIGFTSDF